MQRQICCSSPLQTSVHSQSFCIPTTSWVYMRWKSFTQYVGRRRPWTKERSRGKEITLYLHSVRPVDGTVGKHLKHGKECHMLVKCAIIQAHAATLTLAYTLGFTTKIFQLPALSMPTILWLSPGAWLSCKSKLSWKKNNSCSQNKNRF